MYFLVSFVTMETRSQETVVVTHVSKKLDINVSFM